MRGATGVDVLVVGGGLGGVAAAMHVASSGHRVVLTEETDWLGGQLTSQGVPPDEHPWIESFGCTRTYRSLREGIRAHYRRWYPLTAAARRDPHLNPGGGTVSGLCAEPRVAASVIDALLAPSCASGQLDVLRGHRPVAAAVDRDRIGAVEFEDALTGARRTVQAEVVLDATETGELLALAGVEHRLGAEARDDFGEPHAAAMADPGNQQAVTLCFALEHRAGEDHTIDKPDAYGFWRSHVPESWCGPLLSFDAPDPRTLAPVTRTFAPNGSAPAGRADHRVDDGDRELWRFRRVLARDNFEPGHLDSDVTIVNWPMVDYFLGPVVGGTRAEVAEHTAGARSLGESFLYWLQTEAPRPDGGTGWPGLRPRGDVLGTRDGFAKALYVRESRRLVAQETLTELDVGVEASGGRRDPVRRADSVGIGCYRIDLHPSTGGDPYIDVAARPFAIPLGALVPVRVRNVLPAAKNLGVTHVTNGCTRLHPTEWNVGEAAGALASFCLRRRTEPAAVWAHDDLRDAYLAELDAAGVERHWPDVQAY